jgi:hypothetical protein
MSNIITSLNVFMVAITVCLTVSFCAVIVMVQLRRDVRRCLLRLDVLELNISDMDAEIRDLSPDQGPLALGRD